MRCFVQRFPTSKMLGALQDRALRLGPVDAEFSDGGVDAALLSLMSCLGRQTRRNLRRLFFLFRQPDPLGYVVRTLLHR
jgi:hypothetical protein